MCSYMYSLWWSYAYISTCVDDHMLLYSHVLMFTYFYIHMLWWTHTHSLIILYSHVYMLWWKSCPLAYMPWCSCARTILWLHASMFTWFVYHMLLCSYNSMIECFHVYILWWSQAYFPVPLRSHMLGYFNDYLLLCWNYFVHMLTCIDIHMFDIKTQVHTLGWQNVYWLKG